MSEEIFPNLLVEKFAVFAFWRIAVSGSAGTVGSVRIVSDIGVGDEAAGVVVGWFGFIDIHDGAILV